MITDKEFKILFGQNIKNLRLQKGLKQSELAKEVGLIETSICRIERGYDFVKASTIIKLCAALDCEPATLFSNIKIKNS